MCHDHLHPDEDAGVISQHLFRSDNGALQMPATLLKVLQACENYPENSSITALNPRRGDLNCGQVDLPAATCTCAGTTGTGTRTTVTPTATTFERTAGTGFWH